ncbi:MAG TPA: tRNA pseudouridine(38-40) synthase TruA [Blastocatellia bacterium]|nr:tRNA pseudouridine(38-40) synthase TruA [Blastocatellia bacterium]
MSNIKITIQYDGTNYHGWQIQPNRRTIQGELTRVLSLLAHHPVTIYGAGRTDAGVHAEGQVANFFTERDGDIQQLRDAINGNLDRDIRVVRAEPASDAFNARRSAIEKIYRYRICKDEVVSPFVYRYVYHYRARLDTDLMRLAASELIGTHDFTAFTVAHADTEDRVRTLTRLAVDESASEIAIIVAGGGFLRYMVRTIVGTLIDVGRGKRTAASVGETLLTRERSSAGPTAPACGLTLVRVDY